MLQTILIITGLFLFALALKRRFTKLCAICLAVSLAWIIGLALGFDLIVLAMLMGGSTVGAMYYLSRVLPERFAVFRLPFLLTAFTLIFLILKQTLESSVLIALAVVWLLFGAVFLFRNSKTKNWFKKVVACCKNW